MLPIIAIVILIVLQIMAVTRDSVALVAAARAGARHAMVDPSEAAVLAAATAETGLDPARFSVALGGDRSPGGHVTVTVTYRSPTDLPLVGGFVDDVVLRQQFVVLRE